MKSRARGTVCGCPMHRTPWTCSFPSMEGCRGNDKDDPELRKCPMSGPDYLHYEKRLHAILGPALDAASEERRRAYIWRVLIR